MKLLPNTPKPIRVIIAIVVFLFLSNIFYSGLNFLRILPFEHQYVWGQFASLLCAFFLVRLGYRGSAHGDGKLLAAILCGASVMALLSFVVGQLLYDPTGEDIQPLMFIWPAGLLIGAIIGGGIWLKRNRK